MKISRDKLLISALLLIIYLLLNHSFRNIVLPSYGEFRSLDTGTPGTGWKIASYLIPLLVVCIVTILPVTRLIYTITVTVIALQLFPCTILYRELNTDLRILGLNVLYCLSIPIISLFSWRISGPLVKESSMIKALTLITLALIIPFIIVYGPYIDPKNFLLMNIYESRDIQKQLDTRFLGYTYYPLVNVLIPLLLVLSIQRGQFLRFVMYLSMLMFMFLVGGHKAVFIGALLVALFYYFDYLRKTLLLLAGVTGMLALSIVVYYAFGDLNIVGHFSHRIFFLPSILEVGYFKFFDHQHLYWSDSILRSYIVYPYDLGPTYKIGEFVLSNKITNANNGIISDGFMNFGVAGSIFNIIVVSVIFSVINSFNLSHRFYGLIFLIIFTLMSSFLFTALLTHGILAFLLIGHFFLKDSAELYA